jgi:GYF domain 2
MHFSLAPPVLSLGWFSATAPQGNSMSNRSWFYASEGQQQGPFPETQFRDLITRGTVSAGTLVWTEGMAGWQRAGEIPGLMSAASGPPAMPQPGGAVASAHQSGPLSIDLPVWPFFGRSLLYVIGMLLVIPAPWVATSLYRWMVPRISVPGRPNLAFTGQVGDIWFVLVAMALLDYAGAAGNSIQLVAIPVQAFLSWVILRWIAGNFSSNGQPLPVAFTGSVWAFVGWQVLMFLAIFTIIGWAWVITAFVRWICRNIAGTHREIVFNATGLEMLWRTILFAIGCSFLIPIPWALRWYTRWYISQFALVEHGTLANA